MKYFYAYSNSPEIIGLTIEQAVKGFNRVSNDMLSWKAMDVIGNIIPEEIYAQIKERTFIGDITTLNFNVVYEIGFAIGMGKKIILTKNETIEEDEPTINQVGIFDTIGWLNYQNAEELISKLRGEDGHILYEKELINLDLSAPVFLQETLFRTDFSTRITARIKKAKLSYRSFDPNESPRLSVHEAIKEVGQSYGVIFQLLNNSVRLSKIHNVRAAFMSGLAKGIGVVNLVVQNGDSPVPLDIRDFTKSCKKIEDVDNLIAEFATNVVEAMQDINPNVQEESATLLQKLELGSSSAENEMKNLKSYYLKTDAYLKALRGEVQLIIGRKGSGKSAIFIQIRDKERTRGKNIVLDLKPEGYKLIKFKERVLEFLEEGTFQHTIMAFWEYLLLLEICHRILQTDKNKYKTNSNLYEPYLKLSSFYEKEEYLSEGDFSERMTGLMDNIEKSYKIKYGHSTNVRMSKPEVTELIYSSDIKILRTNLVEYLRKKENVWLLFDNIDKGWPASGLQHQDLIIIRSLIDASRRIQRYFERNNINLYPIIFLRNDVYDLLVDESPDRQKESKELLDWKDSDLLRELIKLRIQSNFNDNETSFEVMWRKICVSFYKGEESFQYIVDRCLMRPRFLINFINQCKGIAINLGHSKIQEEDISKGFSTFSSDLLTDISYEIRDVFPNAENILYSFIGSKSELTILDLKEIINTKIDNEESIKKVIEVLLWYGFLGIRINGDDAKYIYDLNYSLQILKGYIESQQKNLSFVINPGFWPSLIIIN